MNYSAEIRGLMAEEHKLANAAETRCKEHGRDRGYLLLRIERDQIARQGDELRRQAAQEFAALNGWRLTKRNFSPETLVRGGTHSRLGWGYDSQLFDHPVFFREIARPYRAAAIIGQPYDTSADTARAAAVEIGLVLHAPTNVNMSWHYPGWTRFFVFTRPEVTCVQFLPEQLERSEEAAG